MRKHLHVLNVQPFQNELLLEKGSLGSESYTPSQLKEKIISALKDNEKLLAANVIFFTVK
jgi:hypothetical protein